jgi:sortase family protein
VKGRSWWAGGASIALLIGVPTGVSISRSERDVGALGRFGPCAESHASAGTGATGGVRPPKVQVRSGLLEEQRVTFDAAIPRRLRIRAIGVRAPIVPVGVVRGAAKVPAVDTVGWYRFGTRSGRCGSTVLLAHVASGMQRGVFFRLRELGPGDAVTVRTRDGSSTGYRVVARRSYAKATLPDRLFRRTGPPVLTLVTCGGRFSEATGRYEDNVVVFAVPRR